jgi:hypothetical protein
MSEKVWTDVPWDECSHCGGNAEVLTDAPDGYACDGDEARCGCCGCPGCVSADEDGTYINWHDEPEGECDCWWCLSQANREKQDAEIARLNGENSRLWSRLDRADCEIREGNGTYHCRLDNKCDACRTRNEIARLREDNERLRDLIASSAPLAWVANRDMGGAQEWERKAQMAIHGITEKDIAETTYQPPE